MLCLVDSTSHCDDYWGKRELVDFSCVCVGVGGGGYHFLYGAVQRCAPGIGTRVSQ